MRAHLFLAATAALAALSAPANAGMIVNWSSTTALPKNNDFKAFFAAMGISRYTSGGSSISFDRAGTLTVEFLGSGSGYTNSFHYGDQAFDEHDNKSTKLDPMFSISVPAGDFAGFFTSSGHGKTTFGLGSGQIAIFLPQGATPGQNVNELWIGFDDQPRGGDHDFDDFLMHLVFTPKSFNLDKVPEPATLGLFGLGLMGLGLGRRRRK